MNKLALVLCVGRDQYELNWFLMVCCGWR